MGQGCQRVYDHRIREQTVRTGNPDRFPSSAFRGVRR
jgi:hypothetical protein